MKIKCACGCNKKFEEFDKYGRKKKYIHGHNSYLSKTKFKKGMSPWNKGKRYPQITGEKNSQWKGNKVKYTGLHLWVMRWLGKPKKCDKCGTEKSKRFEWANKSREYKRDLTDWIRLCKSCHNKFDNVSEKSMITKIKKYNLSELARKGWKTRRKKLYVNA